MLSKFQELEVNLSGYKYEIVMDNLKRETLGIQNSGLTWCRKHPTLPIRSRYGKCNACRREQDLKVCNECGVNWHDKQYDKCFKCNNGGRVK